MKKIVVAVLVAAANGLCQTPPKDADTLQALLTEVHQLRLDIEAMTVVSQRAQIALYALQMQDAAVARAAQKLDNAHNVCADKEDHRQHTAADIQNLEASLAGPPATEHERLELQARLALSKSDLEVQGADVQRCQATEANASSQMKNEEAKLLELQDRVERLDKSLAH